MQTSLYILQKYLTNFYAFCQNMYLTFLLFLPQFVAVFLLYNSDDSFRISPISCPLFLLPSQFLAVFLMYLCTIPCKLPLFLALYFYYCHNFLPFFFYCISRFLANYPVFLCPLLLLLSQFLAVFLLHLCHDSLSINPYFLPSIFTTVTISCFFFTVSLSRFFANYPVFLALYIYYCHNFLLFFSLSRFLANFHNFLLFFFFLCDDSL